MKFIKNNPTKQVVPVDFLAEASQKFDVTPKIMEQIILRGNNTHQKIAEFLSPTKNSMLNPSDLDGMHEFVKRVEKARLDKESVLIFGDYDVDGISATAIMIKALKMFGITAKYYLPNRYVDGYGLTNEVLQKIKKLYNPSLIITVDCGISAHAEVEFAKTLGIEILVTDHHEIPDVLPKTIVLNAKLPNQKYAFAGLCGTGLAYKIAVALLGEQAEVFLPITALATIADIVPLVEENRAIVTFGLKKLDLLPLGLKLLFKNLGIKLHNCYSTDISFKIAPKLNASGRMGDAQDSLKLYLSEDEEECKRLIAKILEHNSNRKDLCEVVEKDCDNILGKVNLSAPSIILASKDWDHGILGIICSKLVGQFNRPVFLFSEHNGEMKGSARSIPGVNIHELLSSMHEILEVFGGHPVAAGLTIKSQNFDEFVRRVNEYLIKNYNADVFVPKCSYDIEVELADLSPKFTKDLLKLEPCGCENETPKLLIRTDNFEFTPMRNYYNHCNIAVGKKLNLVKFDAVSEYAKLTYGQSLNVVFELQPGGFRSTNLRGIAKAVDCEIASISNFDNMEVVPYLEQIKFQQERKRAEFTTFVDAKTLAPKGYFGTAVVVNTQSGFQDFLNTYDQAFFSKLDICAGVENSGLNTLFICPKHLKFAKFFQRIIFLDPIIDLSYVAKINQLCDAQIFVPQMKPNYDFFEDINISRENFGKIYKDLKERHYKFGTLIEFYQKLKGRNSYFYSYKELYSALCVFQELGLCKICENKSQYEIKINPNVKTELQKSKFYARLEFGKARGGR